jgi:hypothetical protein
MTGGPPRLKFITICHESGKRGYGDRKAARKARRYMMQREGEKAADWDIYRCDSCEMLHIGHHNKHYS